MANRDSNSGVSRVALAGILAAGSMVFLWFSCLAPTGRLGFNAMAGLFPLVGVLRSGRGTGYCCWMAGGLLGLILLPDKGMALLYLLFFGLYPVLKSEFECQKNRILSWGLKLGYFNLVLAVSLLVVSRILFAALPEALRHTPVVWLLGNFVFILYDVGLSRLIFGLFCRIGLDGSKRK